MKSALSVTALVVALASFTLAHPPPQHDVTLSSTRTSIHSHYNSTRTSSSHPHSLTGTTTHHRNSTKTRNSDHHSFTGTTTHPHHNTTLSTTSRHPSLTGTTTRHHNNTTKTTTSRHHSSTGTAARGNHSSTRTSRQHHSSSSPTASSRPVFGRSTSVRHDTTGGAIPWSSTETLILVGTILSVAAALIILFGFLVFPGCFGLWGCIKRHRDQGIIQEGQYREWIELRGINRNRASAPAPGPAPTSAPIKPAVLKRSRVEDLAPGWEDVELGEVEDVRYRR